MSKEKKLLPLVCTRGLSYRASRTASSVGNDAPTEKVVPTKRVCLGGRGREWAAESLRLLETMSNLEDAKLFLEPMNPLKYPEYYNLIHDPIDLSKIMLKFHGGAYPGLIHFSEDMDSMFDNYKQFFKDNSTETYHQVRRLSKWFDAELDQIKCRWYRIYDNGTKLTSSGGSGAVNPRSGSLDARIQAIKASNRRTVNLATKTESLPLQLAMNAIRLPRPLSTLSLKNASHSNASVNRTPVLAFRLASDSKSANSSKLSSSANSQSIILVSKSSADVNRTSSSDSGLMYVCGDWSKQSNHKLSAVPGSDGLCRGGGGGGGGSLLRQVPDVSAQVSSGGADGQKRSSDAALKLDVGNIWFGTARNSMSHPVTVTEDGFHFLLKNADSDVSFTIQRDEIVKCAAYFGNIRKHTLFLFVLPNCVRRLAFLGEEFTLSSLIIMFPPALSQSEIAQLVYLFWRMSRLSMFGELFCEIDQKSAVALLGNIKPTIISNIAEKYKDALGNNTDAQLGVNRFPAEQRSLSNACRRNVNNGTSLNSVTTADDGALLLSDSVDAFSEVDCKIEPPDDDVEPVHEIVDSDLERLGLSSIVDAKCLTVNEKLLSDEAVDNSHDGTKSDVIRKRLKIRYRPGILKHSKRRKVEEVAQKNVSKEMEDKSPLVEEEEDGDKEFTIIEWFPEDENQTAEDEEESVSDSSVNNGSQSLGRSKDENDLEIVAPSNNSDTELDLDVNYEALPAEDEGVVMTGEKINIRCPITQQIMKYPMKNIHCNHCYDRQGIEDLIKHRGDKAKCPVTGCSNRISLCTKDVKHDDQLSFYIQQKLNQADSK